MTAHRSSSASTAPGRRLPWPPWPPRAPAPKESSAPKPKLRHARKSAADEAPGVWAMLRVAAGMPLSTNRAVLHMVCSAAQGTRGGVAVRTHTRARARRWLSDLRQRLERRLRCCRRGAPLSISQLQQLQQESLGVTDQYDGWAQRLRRGKAPSQRGRGSVATFPASAHTAEIGSAGP